MTASLRYHEITAERKPEFVARGYKGKHFFPHRACYVPKPLAYQRRLAKKVWGLSGSQGLWSLVLYASNELICRFPDELFFDKQVMLHDEHLGRPGAVASAHLYIDGHRLCTDEHQSDLVQRIFLRREHKSQIEKRFGTWHHMLLNSILNFAVLKGLRELHVVTAERVLAGYLNREVNPELFERLYNRNINHHFQAKRQGGAWVIDVDQHRDKLIAMTPNSEPIDRPNHSLCIFHDITSSLPGQVNAASETSLHVERMLEIEQDIGVHSTYNIPANLWQTYQPIIEAGEHQAAFRSYDSTPYRCYLRDVKDEAMLMALATRVYRRLDYAARKRLGLASGPPQTVSVILNAWLNRARLLAKQPQVLNPLMRCRNIAYYIKGYRPTPEDQAAGLTDTMLLHYDFEWIIADESEDPHTLINDRHLLKFPTSLTYPDGNGERLDAEAWRAKLLAAVDGNALTTLGLHTANAAHWLPIYRSLLEQLLERAAIRTVQDVANTYHLSRAT